MSCKGVVLIIKVVVLLPRTWKSVSTWGVSEIARAPMFGLQCDRVLVYLLLASPRLDPVIASLWPPALPWKGRPLAQLTDIVRPQSSMGLTSKEGEAREGTSSSVGCQN